MKKWISVILCFIMIILLVHPIAATEVNNTDSVYNVLLVEYSDNLGNYEELQIMIEENHIYANAEQLGDRLGYQVKVGDEYIAIYNKDFSNTVPYGLTTFYYNSKKVGHMLFNNMVDYEAPIETLKNTEGVWIPFEFGLLILNSSNVVLDNQIHIEMPEKNIIDIYMDVLKNNDRYIFDWKTDAGATDESIFAMGTSSYVVQLFNGLLESDGASWAQLIDSFCMNTDSYDAKYAKDFAKLFCTYSDDELNQIVRNMKEKMKPFNGSNWITKAMSGVGELYDDKIGELSKISDDLKKKIIAENKSSILAYNKSYQELDKVCSRADFFYDTTDPFVLASKKVKEASSFLDTFYSVAEIIGYASEFNNQDKFATESLDAFINNTDSESTMSEAMKTTMKEYKNTLETDIITYSAYNYIVNNMEKWLTDALDISSVLLDAKTKALLLTWNIAKGVMPFYKDGINNTNSFLQSMYGSIVQADTFSIYISKRNAVFSDVKNITPENLYVVTQYCYAYLKSCYITRDAAIGSLTDKTKKNNPRYETTQNTINQEIAECLVKLKNADKTNQNGCYGFLPENNEQYLKEYDDSVLINLKKIDIDKIYMKFIENKEYKDYIADEWKMNSPSQYTLIDIDQDGKNELILRDGESEFFDFSIFKYDDIKQCIVGIGINEILGYENTHPYHVAHFIEKMYYSKKYKSLIYSSEKSNEQQYVYESIDRNLLVLNFSILVSDVMHNGNFLYILYDNGEKELSKEEYNVYIEDIEELQWKDIQYNGESIKTIRKNICDIVCEHYNSLYNTNEFVVFDTDYTEKDSKAFVIVRTTSKNDANVYFAGVEIDLTTGNARDEFGESWNIYTN